MTSMGDLISKASSQSELSALLASDKFGIYPAKAYMELDGTTDDYTALYNLINTTIDGADAEIHFKDGTCLIGTSITIPSNVKLVFLNGGMLKPESGVVITGSNAKIGAGLTQIFDLSDSGATGISGTWDTHYVLPEWFGAVGDASTDDSTVMQYALDFAATIKSKLVVPNKTYQLTSGLGFNQEYVHIDGVPGATLQYTGSVAAIWCQDADGGVGSEGFIIENLFINGGGAEGIRLGRTTTIAPAVGTIRNVTIEDMDVGISCVSAQVVSIKNCTIDNCGQGLVFQSESSVYNTDVVVDTTRVINCTNEGVYIKQVWLCNFQGCQFEGNGKEGVKIETFSTGAVHLPTFKDCWFEQNNKSRSGSNYYQFLVKNNVNSTLIDFVNIEDCNFAISGTNNLEIGIFGDVSPIFIKNNRYVTAVGDSSAHGTITVPNYGDVYVEGDDDYSVWSFGKYKAFTSGSSEVQEGSTVTGETSLATATLNAITYSSGTYAGGDAAGIMYFSGDSGTFQAENLLVSAVDVATIGAGGLNANATIWAKNQRKYAQSQEVDFSNSAETFVVLVAKRAGRILNLHTTYTETSGSGLTGVVYKVGTQADDDKYFTGNLSNGVAQWSTASRTLLATDFAANDKILFYCANGVAAAGKLMVSIEYIYD